MKDRFRRGVIDIKVLPTTEQSSILLIYTFTQRECSGMVGGGGEGVNRKQLRIPTRGCPQRFRLSSLPVYGGQIRNMLWFQSGLGVKAHRLLYHSPPGWRGIKKKKSMVNKNMLIETGDFDDQLRHDVCGNYI